METPPPAMKCADCGCCLATVKAGDDWVCWECDAAETCKGKRAPQPPPPYRAVPDPLAASAYAATIPSQEKPMKEKPTKEKPMTVHSGRKRGQRIPEETRAKILAADISVSHSELARQSGITDVSVRKIRRDAGMHRRFAMGAQAAAARKAAQKPAGVRPAGLARRDAPVVIAMPAPELASPGPLTLSISVMPAQLDTLYARFTIEQKLAAVQAGVQRQLE